MTTDINTLLIAALCGGALGLISFIVFAIWVSLQVRDARKEAEKIRIENELARPVLVGMAKEFRTNSGTSFRDAFNRFEKAGAAAQASIDLLQASIELLQRTVVELSRNQSAQDALNEQTDAVIGSMLGKLNGVLEVVAERGELRAALALEKLIADLKSEQQTLRAHAPIALNVNLAGAGSQVGEAAVGAGIKQTQQGLSTTKEGVAKIEEGIDQLKAGG